jgi:DNA-binding GntR family transcriptional regulator
MFSLFSTCSVSSTFSTFSTVSTFSDGYFGHLAFLLSSRLSDNLDIYRRVVLNAFMNAPAILAFEKPATLRARVADFLREAIMQGRLQPGERLREHEWCEQLRISRPTLREALRTLEAERLIVIEPHRGPHVAVMTPKAARDLYAMRALIEGYAARAFALNADQAKRTQLRAAFSALKLQTHNPDRMALLAAKQAFYDVLLEGCDNAVVAELLPGLLSRINLLRATSFSQPDRTPSSLREIEQIMRAIARRDPEAAECAARSHIQQAEIAALAMLNRETTDDNRD